MAWISQGKDLVAWCREVNLDVVNELLAKVVVAGVGHAAFWTRYGARLSEWREVSREASPIMMKSCKFAL